MSDCCRADGVMAVDIEMTTISVRCGELESLKRVRWRWDNYNSDGGDGRLLGRGALTETMSMRANKHGSEGMRRRVAYRTCMYAE